MRVTGSLAICLIAMTKLLITSFIVALAALPAGAQKLFPHGTMVVLPVEDQNLAGEACWNDPNIIGVGLRTTWVGTERDPGIFKCLIKELR